MTITLDAETEAKLRETARREGTEMDALANALLAEALERKTDEFAESVAAIREGLDAVSDGRERSFEGFLAEHKTRYNRDGAPQIK